MKLSRQRLACNLCQPDLFGWADSRRRLALSWPARRLRERYGLTLAEARLVADQFFGGAQ